VPIHERAIVLDVDGTLVDTTYHHALAWYRAFVAHGIVLPVWRIHRHIGMGGDQLIPAVAPGVDRDRAEAIREAQSERYRELIDETRPLDGARDLLFALKELGRIIVLASSAKPEELDHYLDALDARGIVDGWTSSADVEQTKPNPDLVHAALERAGTNDAVMVGDSTWDCEAARRAGLASVALLTGGFSAEELREAGARATFASLPDLTRDACESPANA
jgi:HAD superfamily hydrolase (TIGR01549 family)